MKKSTMLIMLLGVLMFGLVGNLFGQTEEFDWSQVGGMSGDIANSTMLVEVVIHVKMLNDDNDYVPVSSGTISIQDDNGRIIDKSTDANGDVKFFTIVTYNSYYDTSYDGYIAFINSPFFTSNPVDLTWENDYEGFLVLERRN